MAKGNGPVELSLTEHAPALVGREGAPEASPLVNVRAAVLGCNAHTTLAILNLKCRAIFAKLPVDDFPLLVGLTEVRIRVDNGTDFQ